MSDTTITPEEMALWRAESRHEYTYFSTDGTRLILALNALEQAEARAERAESAQLALCDIALELGCACDNEAMLLAANGLKVRAEQAEAEEARLTKEPAGLAHKRLDCPPEFTNCALDCAECRKEAARRAVAESEVKG